MADGEYGLLALTLTYNKSKPHYMGWNIDTDQLDRGATCNLPYRFTKTVMMTYKRKTIKKHTTELPRS